MTGFPTFPMSGKNSKVMISSADGALLTLSEMTKQASYSHKGETLTNQVYLLGAGKTLINMRPAMAPSVAIDGILHGLDITPGAADKVSVTAGIIEVDGVQTAVPANTAVALDIVSASSTIQWNAIIVDKATQVLSALAGTPITDSSALKDDFGDGAGERPLIPADKLLAGWAKVGTTGVIPASNVDYLERENGGVDYEMLPNVGGVKLQTPLAEIHSATIGGTPAARKVKFTGRYLDNVLNYIGTAKSWSLDAASTQISEETFGGNYSSSEISGFSFSFEQLAADRKVIDAAWFRQGHCAVRLIMPNGFYWQSVATVVPKINNSTGAMISISVSGSCGDFPVEG